MEMWGSRYSVPLSPHAGANIDFPRVSSTKFVEVQLEFACWKASVFSRPPRGLAVVTFSGMIKLAMNKVETRDDPLMDGKLLVIRVTCRIGCSVGAKEQGNIVW